MAAGASVLLVVVGGVAAGVAVLTKDGPDAPRIVTAVGDAAQVAPPAGIAADGPEQPHGAPAQLGIEPGSVFPRTSDEADRTATRDPRQQTGTPQTGTLPNGATQTGTLPNGKATLPNGKTTLPNSKTTRQDGKTILPNGPPPTGKITPAPVRPIVPAIPQKPASVPATQVLTTRTELEKRPVPFETRLVRDPLLPPGFREVQKAGAPGEETLRYLVSFTDGKETDRKLMDVSVTRQPQDRIVAFGTGRGLDRPNRRYPDRPRLRECGPGLKICMPFGRSACPPEVDSTREENSLALGGSITVLDQDIQLLNGEALGDLTQMNCARK